MFTGLLQTISKKYLGDLVILERGGKTGGGTKNIYLVKSIRLFEAWENYKKNEITANQLFGICGYLVSPMWDDLNHTIVDFETGINIYFIIGFKYYASIFVNS